MINIATFKVNGKLGLALTLSIFLSTYTFAQKIAEETPAKQRKYMVDVMLKMADPILTNLSKNELKKNMPVEFKSEDTKNYTHLEGFGRLMAGMAPWIELGEDKTEEGKLRKKYTNLALICIKNATDENAADYMNFSEGRQPLVDAAFLAEALLRAPNQLWEPLDEQTKKNVLLSFKATRSVTPGFNNWLLFSAMIEAALLKFEGECDMTRVDYAVRQHLAWYKGDGIYGDGPEFHFDYYNSYVIHPMFIEVLKVMKDANVVQKINYDETYAVEVKRAQRYAEIQEMLISPEATYPAIGRSIVYRFGAFHLLSKIALMKTLPKKTTPQQVRFALFNVIKKQIEAPQTFDDKGWLRIGFFGHQPQLGEGYVSTGSLYLCAQAFLVLGLPATDPFWTEKNEDWSSRKIWRGDAVTLDQAYKEN
ncbi:MAG: DUF2264 domain-containing protein [Pedobacter sp.]|uniref:DUF2264 domain-containing protein n=1 Tax=Pedobacter sp. TaxID=1411316 RepID=UPI002806F5D4|nr:DUF2264 domain-containing protein [Pedobacter sp.]MDQ8005873.1 DUF2264 domain-containing protein [Pedobacter sp.]